MMSEEKIQEYFKFVLPLVKESGQVNIIILKSHIFFINLHSRPLVILDILIKLKQKKNI